MGNFLELLCAFINVMKGLAKIMGEGMRRAEKIHCYLEYKSNILAFPFPGYEICRLQKEIRVGVKRQRRIYNQHKAKIFIVTCRVPALSKQTQHSFSRTHSPCRNRPHSTYCLHEPRRRST